MLSTAAQCKLLLFDLGGVLMRLRDPATTFGLALTVDEFNRRWLLCNAVREYERGLIDRDVFASRAAVELALDYGAEEFLQRFDRWPHSIYPGAVELLHSVAKRFATAILSNTNAMHWERQDIRDRILPAVDHAFLSYETGFVKPDPAAFEQVATRYNYAAEKILFIDDNPLNTAAAARYGMQTATCSGLDSVRAALQSAGVI